MGGFQKERPAHLDRFLVEGPILVPSRYACQLHGQGASSAHHTPRFPVQADRPEDGGEVYTGMVKEPFILIREQAIHEFIRQAIRRPGNAIARPVRYVRLKARPRPNIIR